MGQANRQALVLLLLLVIYGEPIPPKLGKREKEKVVVSREGGKEAKRGQGRQGNPVGTLVAEPPVPFAI